MNNSHSTYLLGLYEGVKDDILRTYPRLRKELERDIRRLRSLVESRGLRVITLDLPAVGKEFDLSLHNGHLILTSNCLTAKKVKTSPVPRLFGALVNLVFDNRGVLRVDASPSAIRFLRQLYNLAKKWKAPCDDKLTFEEARKFIRVDNCVRLPSLKWGDQDGLPMDRSNLLSFGGDSGFRETLLQGFLPGFYPEEADLLQNHGMDRSSLASLLRILQQVADRITAALGEFKAEKWLAKHGPGVVADLPKGVSKYEFPRWSTRLERSFPMDIFGFANYGLWGDFVFQESESNDRFVDRETSSRLLAVPKTQKGPRLIAAEPTANQWCQQVVREYFYGRTSKTWLKHAIRFDDQMPNQLAALAASADSLMSTIDLSEASDRVGCWHVERLFRGNLTLLQALDACRTPFILNSIDKKCSTYHRLNKFSTMGSAVTFPVQSLMFLAVCLASSHFVTKTKVSSRSCESFAWRTRVFGDDLVVERQSGATTLFLLQYLGFKVNMSKTFHGTSLYRESCGMEAFNGVDVTPVYALMEPVRSAPGSCISVVETAHNFYSKGYYAVAERIRRTTREATGITLPYVECGSGVFGWPSPMGFDVNRCQTRFNKELWRMEYLTRRAIWRVRKVADRGASCLLQFFTEIPDPEFYWRSGVGVKVRVLTRPVWEPLPA